MFYLFDSEKGVLIKLRHIKWFLLVVIIVFILGGCRSLQSFSPEQVIENALAATEEPEISYYAEIEFNGLGALGDELFDDALVKEWRDGKRLRQQLKIAKGEVITILSGSKILTYLSEDGVAYETDVDGLTDLVFNPKKQLNQTLSIIAKTHDIETAGKDDVIGRSAIHLKATLRDGEKSIFGNLELWIDDEYWIPLIMKTTSGEFNLEMKYTKIDFDVKFDDSTFELELPDGVTVETIDGQIESEEIALEDIPKRFKRPVFIVEEKGFINMGSITVMEMDEEPDNSSLEIDYKYDGLPGFSLFITESIEIDEELEEKALEVLDDFAEKVTVRNEVGYFVDYPEISMLSWKENGLEYMIKIINPKLNLDIMLPLLDEMIEIK